MQEEGYIVYSDYMGSGPGNKASDGGGRGYIRGRVVALRGCSLSPSLSVRFFFSSVRRLWDAEGRAYARAEQESEASSRSKRISQGGYVGATGIREQKARGCAAIRGGGGGGGKIESESEEEGWLPRRTGGRRRERNNKERRRTRMRRGEGEEEREKRRAATPGAILLEFK